MNYLNQKVWADSHSSVWKEIVSRFGQTAYDDEVTRATHMAILKGEWDAKVYSRQRQAAYAALNQFEMRFDDVTNSTTTWVDAINAIKEEFPK